MIRESKKRYKLTANVVENRVQAGRLTGNSERNEYKRKEEMGGFHCFAQSQRIINDIVNILAIEKR